jgi:hypothetical protein
MILYDMEIASGVSIWGVTMSGSDSGTSPPWQAQRKIKLPMSDFLIFFIQS